MLAALRQRVRRQPSTTEPAAAAEERVSAAPADLQAEAYARAKAAAEYLEALSDEDREEYYAAADELAAVMRETGARDIRACYRGGRPKGLPAGLRSLEEIRFLTNLLRTSAPPGQAPTPTAPDAEADPATKS